MKKDKKKSIRILLIILTILSIGVNVYSHSGKTDSNGGHKDNQNKSGLGSYHYHCGGHPAHLHTNGICPYAPNSSSTKSNTSSYSSDQKATSTIPENIDVTEIKINEKLEKIEIGESKILTATIIPDNASDKNITWSSSNENVATVSATGKVIAKTPGIAYITATSSNGKSDTIEINVKKLPKTENSIVTKTNITNTNNINNTTTSDKKESSNPIVGILTIGLIGGGGYLGYKRHRKRKEKNNNTNNINNHSNINISNKQHKTK